MLKRFFDFILFGNIYVALGAVGLIQSTVVQLQLTDRLYAYSLLAFFATLFIYNLQRIFYAEVKNKKINSIRRKWIAENQTTVKALTLIGFAGVVLTFFSNDTKIIFSLSPLLLLSLAYFIPKVKLRKSAGFKLFTLVSVWTMVTAVVPMLIGKASFFHPVETVQMVIHTLLRFCFMTAICIPFDIRDVAIDSAENVSTLPLQLGENKTRKLAMAFILIYTAFIFIEYFTAIINRSIFAALLLNMLAALLLILRSSSKRSEYYFVAGIDGTMILQGILVIAFSLL